MLKVIRKLRAGFLSNNEKKKSMLCLPMGDNFGTQAEFTIFLIDASLFKKISSK